MVHVKTQVSSNTYGWNGLHDSTAAPIAVSDHNADSVHNIVRYSDHGTCCSGCELNKSRNDSDSVVNNRSPAIIVWGLPKHSNCHIVTIILLNRVGGGLKKSRGGKTWEGKVQTKR